MQNMERKKESTDDVSWENGTCVWEKQEKCNAYQLDCSLLIPSRSIVFTNYFENKKKTFATKLMNIVEFKPILTNPNFKTSF